MAVIFDIERGGLHDGPGIRTVVFFKGCPLRCRWCHNPESWEMAPQTMFYPEKCISCGGCAEGCYTGARSLCGREMSIDEVMVPILSDKPYYGNEGGVTLTGGDPQLQADFALALTEACHRHDISVAIETSMALYRPDLLAQMSLIIADIKLWDDTRHREYTGVGNAAILENIRKADTLGVPILVRTPVIPTVNDTAEEIAAIRDFVKTLKHAVGYELLPYHPFGLDKARAMGLAMPRYLEPTREQMELLRQCAER
ncbi:MAG: glycyl-radical enzyme activating protein [Clostridia bacterium]|nr:glycyl-radical enzyme activating protein [Clostridia bacterium]